MSDDLIRKDLGVLQVENLADKRQVIVNCSAEEPDRVGDVVVQKGIDFASFMKIGGTVLWQHDTDQPIAKALEMKIVDGRLRSKVQFPEPAVSPKAKEIYGLIAAGIINAASIGFSPKEWEPINPREPYGAQRFTAVELMEFSFVSVPCAPSATIVARSASAGGRPVSVAARFLRTIETVEDLEELTPEQQIECDAAIARGDLAVDPQTRRRLREIASDLELTLTRMRESRDRLARKSPKYREALERRATTEAREATPHRFHWNPYADAATNMFNLRCFEMRGGKA
jgi:HK97 family phage prohead protease